MKRLVAGRPMPAVRRCVAIRPNGEPCRAKARQGSDYCAFHDEATLDRVSKGRLKGGMTQSRAVHLEPIALRSPADILASLEDALGIARGSGVSADRVAALQIAAARAALEVWRSAFMDAGLDPATGERIEAMDRVSTLRDLVAGGESSSREPAPLPASEPEPVIDLDALPPELRAALEKYLARQEAELD